MSSSLYTCECEWINKKNRECFERYVSFSGNSSLHHRGKTAMVLAAWGRGFGMEGVKIWDSRPGSLSTEATPWAARVCTCDGYQTACDGRPDRWLRIPRVVMVRRIWAGLVRAGLRRVGASMPRVLRLFFGPCLPFCPPLYFLAVLRFDGMAQTSCVSWSGVDKKIEFGLLEA